jgi:tetratricopeptide (TPR) repeat protein
MQEQNLNTGMKNFNEITKLLKDYHTDKLAQDGRLRVEQLLSDNPHYREVLNGIALELTLQKSNGKINYVWFSAAASVIIGLFVLGISWYNGNKVKALMPQENGLPVFMNLQQQYDDVMNAIAIKNYDTAVAQLKTLPANDTTFYYLGYCYYNLGNNPDALSSYAKVSEGYFAEKAKLWQAFIFIKEDNFDAAKDLLSKPFQFEELIEERDKLLKFVSNK